MAPLAPLTGMGPTQTAVLLAAEYALAARWWQHNRLGYPAHPSDILVAERPDGIEEGIESPTLADQIAHQIMADWDTYAACEGGPLPRSRLFNPETTPHTIAFDLELWRGRQTLTTAIAAIEKLAGAVDVEVDQLILEGLPQRRDTGEHADPLPAPGLPVGPRGRSPARCRLQVVVDSPIRGEVVFTGPRRRDGHLGLGPYADGSGEAEVRLYTPGSMWSTVVIGGTGIGKSRLVENKVISAISGGDTVYWYLDPQRGTSSPALAAHADWFATLDGADAMLGAALAILAARGEENAAFGWTGFTPSADRPGLWIVVEECHRVFAKPKTATAWSYIAREGRKVGIALLCISQYPGLVTFGGNEALRSSVMEGNAIVLRVTSRQAGQLMAGLAVNPLTLPKIPGYAYINGEENGMRTAPFRNREVSRLPDIDDAGQLIGTLSPPPDLPQKEIVGPWLAAQPMPRLDTLAATATLAAGPAYHDRHDAADTGHVVMLERVQSLREGRLHPDLTTLLTQKQDRQHSAAAITGDTDGSELGTIIEFPHPSPPTTTADRPPGSHSS